VADRKRVDMRLWFLLFFLAWFEYAAVAFVQFSLSERSTDTVLSVRISEQKYQPLSAQEFSKLMKKALKGDREAQNRVGIEFARGGIVKKISLKLTNGLRRLPKAETQ